MKYENSGTRCIKVIKKGKVKFSKCRPDSMSRSQGKKCWYPRTGFVTEYSCEISNSSNNCLNVISKGLVFKKLKVNNKVKVFKIKVKQQGQKHKNKNVGTNRKVLSQ